MHDIDGVAYLQGIMPKMAKQPYAATAKTNSATDTVELFLCLPRMVYLKTKHFKPL